MKLIKKSIDSQSTQKGAGAFPSIFYTAMDRRTFLRRSGLTAGAAAVGAALSPTMMRRAEAATGEHFVNYWMHNGHVRIDDEKMAKSLGNFTTVRDVLAAHDPESVRHFLLSSHYRSPLNYTADALDQARASMERLYLALRGGERDDQPGGHDKAYAERFYAAMDDDFNTPLALAVLFDLAREVNRAREAGESDRADGLAGELRRLGHMLGLLQGDAEGFLQGGSAEDPAEVARINALVAERDQARAQRDFARADAIRDQLIGEGIVLEDGTGGTRWRRGR